MKHNKIKIVALDADDTLWINEPYFQEAERKFSDMLEDFLPNHTVSRELLKTEIDNLPLYGYGVKSFVLSMIETALRISNGGLNTDAIHRILEIGKELLQKPIILLDGVEEVLKVLQDKYRLVMATKGDLLDQEKKLQKSGLADYFHHTEIVSEKNEAEYERIIQHLDIQPEEFAIIGNSLKSDVLPVVNIGGTGFHVPYHTTWAYERVEVTVNHEHLYTLKSIWDVLDYL